MRSERSGADRRRVERDQIGRESGGDPSASGEAVDLGRLPGEPPDRVFQREYLEFAHPPLQQVGGEVGVAELAGVSAGVGKPQQQRLVRQEPPDLRLVIVDHHDPEARGEILGERQLDGDVQGGAAALRGQLAERGSVAKVLVCLGFLDGRLVELGAPLLAHSGVCPLAPGRIGVQRRPLRALEREDLPELPGHWRAGRDRPASPGRRSAGRPPAGRRSSRPRRRRRPGAPDPADMAAFSRTTMMAAQVTGRPMSAASCAHSSTWKSGPHVASTVPLPVAPMPPASVQISLSSASRLGTGRPNAPRCDSEREVEKPMAPAAMPSSKRSRIRPTSSGVAARSVACSPRT